MSETLKLPLKDVKEWLGKQTTSIVDPLRLEAKKLLEDIRSKLEELSEATNKLLDDAEKELAKGSRKTYRRAKFLFKLAEKFQKSIDDLVIPNEINAKTLSQASEEIGKTIKMIGQEKTKWFRAISPYFIMSRRKFEVVFKRADDSYQIFSLFLSEEYLKAENAENVFSKLDDLQQALDNLGNYENDKKNRIQKKNLLETKISDMKQKIQAIQNKGEVVALNNVNTKIEELTKSIKNELRHLEKPLLKFQTLVNNPGYNLNPDASIKLEEYLTNPFDALSTEEEGYPLLKNILKKIDGALENKKMKLKPSRLKKAKDQIDNIVNKSALITFQKKCIEIIDKKQEIIASETISEFREKKPELHDQLQDLQRKNDILEARDARFEKLHEEAEKRVIEQKKELEKIIAEISQRVVQIQI
jgi:hypothetical protein